MTETGVRTLLEDAEGVVVVDHRANEGYVTPHEAAGEDAVYISRIRKDPTVPNGMVFWCVSDNLRKGAALNLADCRANCRTRPVWARLAGAISRATGGQLCRLSNSAISMEVALSSIMWWASWLAAAKAALRSCPAVSQQAKIAVSKSPPPATPCGRFA